MKGVKFTPRQVRIQIMKKRFLEQIAKSANISEAARVAGIDRGTAYNWRQADPDFNAKWEQILGHSESIVVQTCSETET